MGSDEPNNFCLDSIFVLGGPFNTGTYLITNPIIKTGYEFGGKL